MQQYFDYHYAGPGFELFGTGHLVSIAIVATVSAFLIWGWQNPSEDGKRRARLLMASIMLLMEASWHGWNLYHGTWSVQHHLPLHSCSLSAWGSIYVLLTRSFRAYEILYFIGVSGAVQTLLTPDAGSYGLPHFRAIQTLGAHGMIVIAMVYMTVIEGYRPTWASLWKTLLFANLYLVVITGINVALGSNYMYSLRKPETASLLDMMGPWPWYLLGAEFVALLMFVLLYLPIAWSNRQLQTAGETRGSRQTSTIRRAQQGD